MLGVVVNNKPELLARVGKHNVIDQGFGVSCGKQSSMALKAFWSHTNASLVDEGIDEIKGFSPDISHQSYAITYEQYLEFLAMTREIHLAQLERYKERKLPSADYKALTYPQKGVYLLRNGIKCFTPTKEESGKVTFEYKQITTLEQKDDAHDKQLQKDIISGANVIKVSNTCRTTARALLNYTLHYSPNVPAFFAIGLDYKTKLVDGKPTANTFYILPQPPSCFKVNPTQMKVLKELYKKLEDLPKNHPASDATRKKFDELKHIYRDIAGEPKLQLTVLLDKITTHRLTNNPLFNIRRGQGLISKFAGMLVIKTGTQQAYDRMEKAVRQEIKRVEKVNTVVSKSADPDELQSDGNSPPHPMT